MGGAVTEQEGSQGYGSGGGLSVVLVVGGSLEGAGLADSRAVGGEGGLSAA